VTAAKSERLEDVVAQLEESERAGRTVEQIASTWRFAGVNDPAEVYAWLDVGVVDGHRAGLLRLAGVTPNQMLRLQDSRNVGVAFSMGVLSVSDVTKRIANLDAASREPR
jgi:hypothetical protein